MSNQIKVINQETGEPLWVDMNTYHSCIEHYKKENSKGNKVVILDSGLQLPLALYDKLNKGLEPDIIYCNTESNSLEGIHKILREHDQQKLNELTKSIDESIMQIPYRVERLPEIKLEPIPQLKQEKKSILKNPFHNQYNHEQRKKYQRNKR